ncbi:MAG: crossover junction endodeoxyribonuclease RuvC [Negativicutes bacterium]|nr:crossover junction endodeoxyribonuclease RuvC [Negativicutes bacterium]
MVVLGVDPGLARCGFGLVKDEPGSRLTAVRYGTIETSSRLDDSSRLAVLYNQLTGIIDSFTPQLVAVEKLFFNKNTRTAISVSQARGVVLLCAALRGVPVREFTPLQVKQALTGEGRADKRQVEYMVRVLLSIAVPISPDDAADALAVAICARHYVNWG